MLSTFDDSIADRARVERACETLYFRHQARLHQYARMRGCDEPDAQDAVQELFLRMIRLGHLVRLSAESDETQAAHLMRTLRCMIINQWRTRVALRRGGGLAAASLNELADESSEVPCASDPSSDHDQAWAVRLLESGLAQLRSRMDPVRWHLIEPSLLDEASPGGFRRAAAAQRVAAHRARLELRKYLTREAGYDADSRRASAELFHAAGRHGC